MFLFFEHISSDLTSKLIWATNLQLCLFYIIFNINCIMYYFLKVITALNLKILFLQQIIVQLWNICFPLSAGGGNRWQFAE